MSYVRGKLAFFPRVGDIITKDGTDFAIIAAGTNVLLLYRFDKCGTYVVAHYPRVYDGELVWGQGHYYMLFNEEEKVNTFHEAVEKFAAIDSEEKEWEARHNG